MPWLNRLVNVFRPARCRDEISEEIRYHIDARIEANCSAGMSPEDARADALRRFGGALLAMEKSHDANIFVWLETILQDLRFGIRSLRASLGVAAAVTFSLALAIGANTAVFSVINSVLLRALPYKDPNRIVIPAMTNALNGGRMNVSVPNFDDWKSRVKSFSEVAGFRDADASFAVNGEPGWTDFAWVYGDFFRLWGRSPLLGRVFGPGSADPRQAVLSYRMWQRYFDSSPGAIGRTLRLSGIDFQIVGVMPEDFAFPSKGTQLWAPAQALPNWPSLRARREGGFFSVAARLRSGVDLDQAAAELKVITQQLVSQYPDANEGRTTRIIPLAAEVNGKTIPFMLAVLFGAVFMVLLIACANAANLLLARGTARRTEIALRTALGAGRARILRQLLTESVLLSLLAGLLALPCAAWGIRALIALAPRGIARLDQAHIDGRVLAFSLVLSLATGILFGLAPAVRVSRDVALRTHTSGLDSRLLRRSLVIAEVAFAVVLLTGAGLLIRSLAAVQSVDPGFRTSRVLAATLRFSNTLPPERRAALYRDAMAHIRDLSGVQAAGAVSTMFFVGDEGKFGLRAVEGRAAQPRAQWTPMTWSTISGDYFQALSVPLLRGRFFTAQDTRNAPPVVIINETMARRYWPGEDPIGQGLKGFDPRGRNDEWVRVVGVVKDMHSRGLERSPMAQIYETQAQSLDETDNLIVRGDVSAEALRDTIRSIDKTAAWSDVATLEDRLREQEAPRRYQTLLLSLFAFVALALAAAGLFGMMHYSVAKRTREIGIRMAIGARPATVVQMVMREGLLLVAIGLALGLAGSLALTRAIGSLLFEVRPADPLTLNAVSLVLALIALLACYLPARRATRIDPVLALHCE